MSSKCIISIKNENWLKREIVLTQHTDGHPNNILLPLVAELREIHQDFNEQGDPGWFMDPGRLAGVLITRSVPVRSESLNSLLKSISPSLRNKLESSMFIGMPTLLPDARVYDANYEYSILLKDIEEESFFGFILEVYKIQNNKRVSVIAITEENFNKNKITREIYEEVEK